MQRITLTSFSKMNHEKIQKKNKQTRKQIKTHLHVSYSTYGVFVVRATTVKVLLIVY